MLDGGGYHSSTLYADTRDGGFYKSSNQTKPMPHTHYPAPPAPPCPPMPNKQPEVNDSLREFVSTILKHFPDHDLTYCFREQKFNNLKTQDMFNTWKLAREYHG